MSAPSKGERLEEYAASIGMSRKELAEFCEDVLINEGQLPEHTRISLQEFKFDNDLEDEEEFHRFVGQCASECRCPAMCSAGCEVELDGECPHGFPSLFREMGIV